MLKLTKTGIGLLTRQYRSVLKKCWMINVGLWQAMGDAVSKAVSVPARLVASLLSGGALNGEAFNVLDEILLSRLFERKLASLTAIGLTIAAATLPSEAEAGLLCYGSDGTVKYSTNTTCPNGTTTRLLSLDGINSTATIGSHSVALGDLAEATGTNSTALGYLAKATGGWSTALGYKAKATGSSSTALGDLAEATGSYSTALGHYTQVSSNNSVAVGNGAHVTGFESTALGTSAQATGTDSTALGYYAQATGDNSTALGTSAQATGKGSTAIGYRSVADEANTVSVGRFGADSATLAQMKADIDGGMSESDFTTKYTQYNANYKAHNFYWNYFDYRDLERAVEMSGIAEITHRITNVADGVNAHDAATKGQLDTALNNYYKNVEFSMAKSFIKAANDNNFTTLNCAKEA